MNIREQKIRLWFGMWLQKRDLGMEELFSDDAVYIESWGPEYAGQPVQKARPHYRIWPGQAGLDADDDADDAYCTDHTHYSDGTHYADNAYHPGHVHRYRNRGNGHADTAADRNGNWGDGRIIRKRRKAADAGG